MFPGRAFTGGAGAVLIGSLLLLAPASPGRAQQPPPGGKPAPPPGGGQPGAPPSGQDAIIRAYADRLRFFERRLTPQQAAAIANDVVENSRRSRVDARLIMAVIAVEHPFQKVRDTREGPVVDKVPAGVIVELIARDVSVRMKNQGEGKPTLEMVRRAMADRAATRLFPNDSEGRQVDAYAQDVTRAYADLIGEGGQPGRPRPDGPPPGGDKAGGAGAERGPDR